MRASNARRGREACGRGRAPSKLIGRTLVLAFTVGAAVLIVAPSVAQETTSYTYDALGRLTKVDHGTTGPIAGVQSNYSYDHADNRTQVQVINANAGVTFSIASNGAVTEGGNSVFTVTKSGSAVGSLTVNYATADGTAVAPGDYAASSGTLTFTSAQTSQTVSVPTVDDTVIENPESFSMSLSSPGGGSTITSGTAAATINDNDTPPCTGVSFAIASNGAVTEGAGSVFTVTKAGSASGTCTVNYATSGGTATSGSDFTAASGTLSFSPTQTSQTVTVATIDDTIVESPETFSLALSSPANGGTLGTPSSATATINDNDVANQPPVTHPDSASTTSCGIVTVNVVANDTDPEGNYPLHLVAIVSSTNGSATIVSTTSIEFDAVAGPKTGVVTYTVSDSLGATSNGTLSVSIANGICQ
jgi:hypothetical protein